MQVLTSVANTAEKHQHTFESPETLKSPVKPALSGHFFLLGTILSRVFRPYLKLDGTLSSIVTIKLLNTKPYHKYGPPREVIETAKNGTAKYNEARKLYHCIYYIFHISKLYHF